MTKLTQAAIDKAKWRRRFSKTNGKPLPTQLTDGGDKGNLSSFGLRLLVSPTGRKRFVQLLWIAGKPISIQLGNAMFVSLKEARAAAMDNYQCARNGGDPRRGKEQQTEVKPFCPTFAEGLEAVIALRPTGYDADKRRMAEQYAGELNAMRIDEIRRADIKAALSPIWATKHVTAKKLRGVIAAVLDWAINEEIRTDNPAHLITKGLPRVAKKVAPRPAVAHSEVGKALVALRQCKASLATRLAIEFQVLTGVRPGEAQGALWSEIDLDAGVWTIPVERMKRKHGDHAVPLSKQAIAVLKQAKEGFDDAYRVFPGTYKVAVGKAMRALNLPSDQAGKAAVAHGFRSSFSTWAHEQLGVSHDAVELSLHHAIGSVVSRIYNRTELWEQRSPLMQAWADYLTK